MVEDKKQQQNNNSSVLSVTLTRVIQYLFVCHLKQDKGLNPLCGASPLPTQCIYSNWSKLNSTKTEEVIRQYDQIEANPLLMGEGGQGNFIFENLFI